MATTIKFRRGSSVEWTSKDPVLGAGEVGYETDSAFFKIGTGTSRWSDLPYFIDGLTQQSLTQDAIEQAIADSGGDGSDPRIGNMSLLVTTNKTTVVAAINEIDTLMVPFTLLYDNAKAG